MNDKIPGGRWAVSPDREHPTKNITHDIVLELDGQTVVLTGYVFKAAVEIVEAHNDAWEQFDDAVRAITTVVTVHSDSVAGEVYRQAMTDVRSGLSAIELYGVGHYLDGDDDE